MVCVCAQETVKGELCDLSDSQFQLLADTLRDQMLNVSLSPSTINPSTDSQKSGYLNIGHVNTSYLVHCREVVLSSEVQNVRITTMRYQISGGLKRVLYMRLQYMIVHVRDEPCIGGSPAQG